MPTYKVHFSERETLPDLLERRAAQLDLTVEQLIKRFICTGMEDFGKTNQPSIPGESLEDYLVKNGALKPSDSSSE